MIYDILYALTASNKAGITSSSIDEAQYALKYFIITLISVSIKDNYMFHELPFKEKVFNTCSTDIMSL